MEIEDTDIIDIALELLDDQQDALEDIDTKLIGIENYYQIKELFDKYGDSPIICDMIGMSQEEFSHLENNIESSLEGIFGKIKETVQNLSRKLAVKRYEALLKKEKIKIKPGVTYQATGFGVDPSTHTGHFDTHFAVKTLCIPNPYKTETFEEYSKKVDAYNEAVKSVRGVIYFDNNYPSFDLIVEYARKTSQYFEQAIAAVNDITKKDAAFDKRMAGKTDPVLTSDQLKKNKLYISVLRRMIAQHDQMFLSIINAIRVQHTGKTEAKANQAKPSNDDNGYW